MALIWGVPYLLIKIAVAELAPATLVFLALIAEVGPIRSTISTYVNPAVAVVLGVLLLGQPFTLGIAAAFG